MRSFAIEEPGSPVPALYATLTQADKTLMQSQFGTPGCTDRAACSGRNANSPFCSPGNPAQTVSFATSSKMSESNRRRVNRLIRIFHQSWTEKLQANLQLSTKDGEISIKLDLQLGRPEDIVPGPVAAGHPAGTPQRRRPRRRRGPAAKERSRQRAAAYHASRAGAQGPLPPPPPPPPKV